MKTAVVTGANKGIGHCIAAGLLKQNYFVYVACRSLSNGEQALKALPSHNNAELLELDLDNPATIAAAAKRLRETKDFHGIDVLVNNAGFAYHTDATEHFGVQAKVTLGTNLFGTLAVIEAFAPLMAGQGRIINVSSRAGPLSLMSPAVKAELTSPNATIDRIKALGAAFVAAAQTLDHGKQGWPNTAYGTSKCLLTAATLVLARSPEFLAKGITVNACCPGWCKTDMSSHSGSRTAEQGADVAVWMASAPEMEGVTGKFMAERKEIDW